MPVSDVSWKFSPNSINITPGLTKVIQSGKSTPCTSSTQSGSPLGGACSFCKTINWLLNYSTIRLLLENSIPVAQSYLPVVLEMKAQGQRRLMHSLGLESCNQCFKVLPFFLAACSSNDPSWQIDEMFLIASLHCPGTKISHTSCFCNWLLSSFLLRFWHHFLHQLGTNRAICNLMW